MSRWLVAPLALLVFAQPVIGGVRGHSSIRRASPCASRPGREWGDNFEQCFPLQTLRCHSVGLSNGIQLESKSQ